MRPPWTPEAIALRAEGILARALPQVSAAGSYSSTTSTLLLPALMNAAPTRPPITYALPFTTPAVAWLRGVGIAARCRQVLVAGSYSSTVETELCGRCGCTAVSLEPGGVVAPPITYILSPTVTATGEPRFVGMGANAFQASAAGSYSHAFSIGVHAGGPDAGTVNRPKPQILPP